jgi:hypothetical protein
MRDPRLTKPRAGSGFPEHRIEHLTEAESSGLKLSAYAANLFPPLQIRSVSAGYTDLRLTTAAALQTQVNVQSARSIFIRPKHHCNPKSCKTIFFYPLFPVCKFQSSSLTFIFGLKKAFSG